MKEECGIGSEKIMRNSSLSCYAKCVYAYIASMAEHSNKCHLSLKTIANDLNISESRATGYINELINAGVIVEERTLNEKLSRQSEYRINDDLQDVREHKDWWRTK